MSEFYLHPPSSLSYLMVTYAARRIYGDVYGRDVEEDAELGPTMADRMKEQLAAPAATRVSAVLSNVTNGTVASA